MSQSQQHLEQQRRETASDSPYRRDSWWGDSSETNDKPTGHDPKPFEYKKERAAYVAHSYHRDHARALCPITLFSTPDNQLTILFDWLENWEPSNDEWESDYDHDPFALHTHNHETELTEPEIHVPHDAPEEIGITEYGQRRHRSRFNERFGDVTGPYLAELDAKDFENEVDDLLDFWCTAYDLSDRIRDELKNRGMRMKHQGDHRDLDILENLILEVTTGGSILED